MISLPLLVCMHGYDVQSNIIVHWNYAACVCVEAVRLTQPVALSPSRDTVSFGALRAE